MPSLHFPVAELGLYAGSGCAARSAASLANRSRMLRRCMSQRNPSGCSAAGRDMPLCPASPFIPFCRKHSPPAPLLPTAGEGGWWAPGSALRRQNTSAPRRRQRWDTARRHPTAAGNLGPAQGGQVSAACGRGKGKGGTGRTRAQSLLLGGEGVPDAPAPPPRCRCRGDDGLCGVPPLWPAELGWGGPRRAALGCAAFGSAPTPPSGGGLRRRAVRVRRGEWAAAAARGHGEHAARVLRFGVLWTWSRGVSAALLIFLLF